MTGGVRRRSQRSTRPGAVSGRLASWWFLDADASWFPRLYEAFFTHSGWGRRLRAEEHRVIAATLRARLRPGDRVLEIGSGTGDYTRVLHDAGATVSARDGSPAMVAYLRERLQREHRPVDVQLGALPDRLNASGSDAAGMDGVVAIGVFNYNQLDGCLRGCAQQLGAEGWLVFNVPSPSRAGWHYVALEGLVRRRVHLWAPHQVHAATRRADLEVAHGPVPAGVTDLYTCRFRSASRP
jgi:SAM-dependent methyltransferase